MSRIAQALQRLRNADPAGDHPASRLAVSVGHVAEVAGSLPAVWRGLGSDRHANVPSSSARGPGVAPTAIVLAVLAGGLVAVLVGRRLLFPDVFTAATAVTALDGIVFTGTITPAVQVTVAAPATGTVLEMLVRVGDTVVKGSPLVRLDDSAARAELESALFEERAAAERLKELQGRAASLDRQIAQRRLDVAAAAAALQSAQSEVQQVPARQIRDSTARAEAILDQARRSLARAQELYAAGVIARNAYEEAEVAVRVAEDDLTRAQDAAKATEQLEAAQDALGRAQADLARAEARAQREALQDQVAQAQLALERASAVVNSARQKVEAAVVTAPWDGVVADVPVGLGDHLAAGAPVARLASTRELMVDVEVSSRLINALRPTQAVTIALPTSPVQYQSGDIYSISPVPSVRMTHLVRVRLHNPTGMLLSGQPAQVVFHDDE